MKYIIAFIVSLGLAWVDQKYVSNDYHYIFGGVSVAIIAELLNVL
jgi:hypothetical protein